MLKVRALPLEPFFKAPGIKGSFLQTATSQHIQADNFVALFGILPTLSLPEQERISLNSHLCALAVRVLESNSPARRMQNRLGRKA